MQFSIIIPALNEALLIENCLTALQSLRNIAELIVVDGGSTDNTCELARPLADRVISADKGRARQMNAGAEQASGEVLIFLHADTLLPAGALPRIQEHLHNGSVWGRFDVRLTGRHPMYKVIGFMMNWRSRLSGIATGDQAIFVTRDLFERVGGYPDLALMEDITLSAALKKIARPACLFDKVSTSPRRWQKFGIAKTILLMWSLRFRYCFEKDTHKLARLYSEGRFW